MSMILIFFLVDQILVSTMFESLLGKFFSLKNTPINKTKMSYIYLYYLHGNFQTLCRQLIFWSD